MLQRLCPALLWLIPSFLVAVDFPSGCLLVFGKVQHQTNGPYRVRLCPHLCARQCSFGHGLVFRTQSHSLVTADKLVNDFFFLDMVTFFTAEIFPLWPLTMARIVAWDVVDTTAVRGQTLAPKNPRSLGVSANCCVTQDDLIGVCVRALDRSLHPSFSL